MEAHKGEGTGTAQSAPSDGSRNERSVILGGEQSNLLGPSEETERRTG
jgi:hypothetical protein